MPNEKENTKAATKQYKTDGGKTKSNAIEVPSISLPKGGGAIKGIDQKFTVNAVNGTAAFSIPLPVSAARGAMPNLSLSYNSGGGNGIFGLGWSLSLPSIKRKTDKELPQYNDYIDSDTYLLSEAEDLVPEFERNGDGTFKLTNGDFTILEKDSPDTLWRIRFYKPRIEGLFARIERWTKKSNDEIKWRVISKDNVTTLYGWTAATRLANPTNALRIYEWLPEIVFDDKGNCAHYYYKAEDAAGGSVYLTQPHNRNRYKNSNITYTNLYLEKVLYGNKTPYAYGNDLSFPYGSAFPADADFMFETVLDYGQYNPVAPYTVNGVWDFRTDAFSEYKAGFEIRTTRLCKRVLLFHHFTDTINPDKYLIGGDALVKSLDFTYGTNTNAGFTFLNSVTSKGYIKYVDYHDVNDPNDNELLYSSKSLPAMEFSYSAHQWNKTVKTVSPENVMHAPVGLSEPYQFADLYNEGLSGILTEQGGAWYYKRNNGGGNFEAAHQVSPKPSFSGLGGALQLLDLDGDGVKQLVNFNNSPQGYFEISTPPSTSLGVTLVEGSEWQKFKTFNTLPNINLNDRNARLLDLNGDGKTDLLITEENVFRWYESDGREGYKDYHTTPYSSVIPSGVEGEEDGPKLMFADSTQSIYLADMSGDGLVDIVRIRNGEVCYWPNLGYGNFGTKVSMDGAPVFDSDADFNPAYLKIADIDGSGTPDLIYLGKNKFSCWLNFSGNSFSSAPYEIEGFPAISNNANITVTDLLGNGLACIVWSSALQKDANAPLRYIDLMNSKKPHMMIKHINNMGKEVELEYTPSTKFYIDDKLAGRPWVTKLHFPVYCVSKVTSKDKVTGHTFTSNYSYHHGYFDHAEKEFRGFGRVDQTDTDTAEHWIVSGGTNLSDASVNQAPVLTRSWFHTGAYILDKKILDQFATEYWYAEYNRQLTPGVTSLETALPAARIVPDNLNASNAAYVSNISPIEKREALRACKSMALRSEVFALEGTLQEQLKPYTVGTHNCMIELLQPKGKNKHAVFCVKESEAITYSYERNLADPRIAHKLNLEMDIYGNVLKSASVVYPRQIPITIPASPPQTVIALTALQTEQAKTAIVYTLNTFTNDVNLTDDYRLRLPAESKTYEVTKLSKSSPAPPSPNIHLYTVNDFNAVLSATEIPYEQVTPSATVTNIRLIEHVKSLYYFNDLSGKLASGVLESKGIPYENYQLAYTENTFSDMIENIFNEPAAVPAIVRVTGVDMLLGQFQRLDLDNDGFDDGDKEHDWWIRSGVVKYRKSAETTDAPAKTRFYTPVSYTDQYGSTTAVTYDAKYLFIEEVTDAVGNLSEVVTFDYRTLSPVIMKDANNNLSEVLLDELGLPKAMALYGKGSPSQADTLTGLTAQTLTQESTDITAYFTAANAALTNYATLETKANTLLQQATARFVYDFDAYKNSGGTLPAVVSSILREEHYINNSSSKLQLSFEYSDGNNKVVMKKVQAEGGEAKQVSTSLNPTTGIYSITVNSIDTTTLSPPTLRWIGNGRTVLNNKGNPVKQYEPYFSVSAKYESHKELVEQGVTPLLHYDAPGRLIRTDFPDGSFSKVEFDSWKQKLYDQNDTCMDSDWYTQMTGGSAQEADAATKAAAHYNTPKTVHFDTLGRPVSEEETDGSNTLYTHLFLDIEGNLKKVQDARNNTVMQYKYDMLGQMVYQHSMDSGKRWLLHDCMGAPLRTWDQRDHEIEFTYDALHRPLEVKILGGDGPTALNNVVEKYIYGENQPNPQTNNLRGNLYRHYDTGGLEEMAVYDFKNQPQSVKRQLAQDYKNTVDWPNSTLESNSYTIATTFDALGRIKTQTAPDGSLITPSYNPRGILVSETVNQSSTLTTPLTNIKYDAKGQRTRVENGNNTYTEYSYDPNTFRLTQLLTKRTNNSKLQDLNYTYDAIGNITHIEDTALATVFYNNSVIPPIHNYTYDALYRLKEATGREMLTMATFGSKDNWDDAPFKTPFAGAGSVNLQNYTQQYDYDEVGNIKKLKHIGDQTGSYTRDYTYSGTNNRLTLTTVGSDTYNYNYHAKHGFLTDMPHLPVLKWNFKEEICETSKTSATLPAVPETTWYQYDSKGKRIRKITENQAVRSPGTPKNQRIYIEGYEYYEDYGSGDQTHTLSLIDDGRRFVMYENSSTQGSLMRYQHPNHQGSCTLETDDTGQIINYEEYHPFGTTSYQAKNTAITAAAKQYRYIGKERDEESGLYYCGARYYVPWLCRFISCDPKASEFPNQSPYNYSFNNPINLSDPSGMAPEGGGDDKPKVDNIGFPANPKDGQQFVHLNKDQNTNWGYVYDAQSKSWIGTGAAANLTEVEVTATATPRAVFTYGSGSNIERTQPHVAFTVQSISYGGGFGVGAEGSFKEFFVGTNIHTKDFLYNKGEQFGVWEVDLKGGTVGHGASLKAGYGELLNPDPWKPISQQIMDINDYDIEATVGFVTASSTSEVTLGQSRLNYNMVGVAYGFKAKFESPIPLEVSSGFNGLVYTSLQPATREDSARTAKAFPDHAISRAFNAKQSARIYTKTKILD